MIEALPRSFTISTAVHACVVALGLVVASKASPGAAVRTITTASSVMEIAMEVEQPPVALPPPPPPPPPAPAPPPPAAAAARAPRAPRAAAPSAPSAPSAPAPSAPAPSAPAPAPAAPAPVVTSEGGEPGMATAPAGASAAATAVIAPARSGQGTAAAAPSLPPGPSFDAGSYLAGVTARVRRHRNYPAIAQEMGLEGTVEVRVVLAPDGSFAAPPSIDESCGHEILDDEALRIVRRAAPFPPLVGRNDRVTLRVPVHFHLDV